MRRTVALVQDLLAGPAGLAGFDLAADAPHEGLPLLEYRLVVDGRSPVLLDIGAWPAPPGITAELWSPSDLVRAPVARSAADVAIERRRWPFDPSVNREALAGEIAGEVGDWLTSWSGRSGQR